MKGTKYLSKLTEKRTRSILAILAMFVCTSICLGEQKGQTKTLNSSVTHGQHVAGNSDKDDGTSNIQSEEQLLVIKYL